MKKQDNYQWEKFTRRANVDIFSIIEIDRGFYKIFWSYFKNHGEYMFTHFHNGTFTHYIKGDIKGAAMDFFNKFLGSPTKILKEYRLSLKKIANSKTLSLNWKSLLGKDPALPKLLRAYKDYLNDFRFFMFRFSIIPYLAIEFWQEYFDKKFFQIIKNNKNLKNKDIIIESAYLPFKKTSLAVLQEKIGKKYNPEKLLKDYQFLRSWTAIWFNPLDKKWLKSLEKKFRINKKKYSTPKIIKLLKVSGKTKRELELLPYITFYKDWRDETRRKQIYLWSYLFDIIADKLKVKRNDLGYLTPKELEDGLCSGKIDKKKILWRQFHQSVSVLDKKNFDIILLDKKISGYGKIIKKLETQKTLKTFSGLSANKGKTDGKVRIINSFEDMRLMKSGEILVTNTTHPNYLPAMKLAKAIITNEGGMISHAAIVSRELGIPCIVGTKIATKVLKDGDLIEVDANKGIITKL